MRLIQPRSISVCALLVPCALLGCVWVCAAADAPVPAATSVSPATATDASRAALPAGSAGPAATTPEAADAATASLPRARSPAAAHTQRPLNPMQAEIQVAAAEEAAALANLETQFTSEPDPTIALSIQQAIQRAKLDGMVRILEIQARYARFLGRTQAAQTLDAAIAQLSAPALTGIPVERTATAAPRADGAGSH